MGKWVFPGGYVDRGESTTEAAVRETLEESRLEVATRSLLGVYSYSGSPNVIIVYVAEVVGGTLAAGDESTEAGDLSAVRGFPGASWPFPARWKRSGTIERLLWPGTDYASVGVWFAEFAVWKGDDSGWQCQAWGKGPPSSACR